VIVRWFRSHPTERGDGVFFGASGGGEGGDERLKVGEGGEGQDGVPPLGRFVLIDSPEALGVEPARVSLAVDAGRGVVAVF